MEIRGKTIAYASFRNKERNKNYKKLLEEIQLMENLFNINI